MSPQNCDIQLRVKRELEALTTELDHRKAKARPMPRSVFLAYQALIAKHHRRLAGLKGP